MMHPRHLSPAVPHGGRFWSIWFGVNAAVLAGICALNVRDAYSLVVFIGVAYAVVLVPAQVVALRSVTPGSRRPWIVACAPVVVGLLWLPLYMVAVLLLFLVFEVFFRLIPRSDEILPFLTPALTGALAGLVQAWVLRPYWQRTILLVGGHAILATLVGCIAAGLFTGVPGLFMTTRDLWDPMRLAPGALLGLGVAAGIWLVLRRLEPQPDLPSARTTTEPPPPRDLAQRPDAFIVGLWLGAHVLLLVVLNAIIPSVPQSPLFGLLGYALTVGLLQALLIGPWLGGDTGLTEVRVMCLAVLPPLAGIPSLILGLGLLTAAAMIHLIPSPVGHSPAGFPILSPYLAVTTFPGVGLTLGWLQWRRIRSYSRGPGWSGLYLLAQALAPLVLMGITHGLLLVSPGHQGVRGALLVHRSVYAVAGAGVAGLVVALLVGGALWLMVRPERPAQDTPMQLAA
ncbi:MAG: hypothetical protein IT306_12025 [Chloroflexi bacterium]|nr:hypothetical protein [Chloroflexota bacterium]